MSSGNATLGIHLELKSTKIIVHDVNEHRILALAASDERAPLIGDNQVLVESIINQYLLGGCPG